MNVMEKVGPEVKQRRFFSLMLGEFRVQGQAMVEFSLMLFLIIALCAGMLYSIRLLTFQFWAQQEARYVAFDQVWHSYSASTDPLGEPVDELSDRDTVRRPKLLDRLEVEREVDDAGSVADLFPLFSRANTTRRSSSASMKVAEESPIMMAKAEKPIWKRRTREWFPKGLPWERMDFSIVQPAYASRKVRRRSSRGRDWLDDEELENEPLLIEELYVPRRKLDVGFIKVMRDLDFGETLCPALAAVMARHGSSAGVAHFEDPECPDRYNTGFGVHLGENVRFKELFRDYEYRMERGFGQGEALHETVKVEMASQFYSFFDNLVRFAQEGTVAFIVGDRLGYLNPQSWSSVLRMIQEARYIGSSVAVGRIAMYIGEISFTSADSRSWREEKGFEDVVNQVLHEEANEGIPGITNEFSLPIWLLPIPPDFSVIAGGLQSGIMKNVLTQDSHLFDPLIDQSNKRIHVAYNSGGGLFPAARKRFDSRGVELTANFYLVTQPWHITRRVSPLGAWRSVGTQTDTMSDDTLEGILRRRTFGLWAFPKRPIELLDPITQIPELGMLDSILEPFRYVEGAFSAMIAFMLDNPLIDIADALSEIPYIGQFVPTLPKWPSVRPLAYPRTVEMTNDKMIRDQTRNFQHYIDEQKEFHDREPDPSFN